MLALTTCARVLAQRGSAHYCIHSSVRPLRARWRLLHAREQGCACVRACVGNLGGRGTNGLAWPVQNARARIACDDGRRRGRADIHGLRCLVCLHRLNLRKPSHAAFGSSAHEVSRRSLLSVTPACYDRAPCGMQPTRQTSNVQQHHADDAADGTDGYSGVLNGTQRYSATGR